MLEGFQLLIIHVVITFSTLANCEKVFSRIDMTGLGLAHQSATLSLNSNGEKTIAKKVIFCVNLIQEFLIDYSIQVTVMSLTI